MPEGFTVRLTRSETSVFVPKGGSILFALMDQGIQVPFSCGTGICGTCETSVVSGTPEHRDFVLTDEEKATNRTMMICCGGAQSAELELEL